MLFKLNKGSLFSKTITIGIITFLILLSFVSLGQVNNDINDDEEDIYKKKITKLTTLPKDKYPTIKNTVITPRVKSTFSNITTILPKEHFPIQKHPQIYTHNDIVFSLIETKHNPLSPSQLTATYSKDNGKTWLERMTISHNITSFSNPTFDYTGDPDMQVYGSHLLDAKTGTQLIFGFPNVTNPETNYDGSTNNFDMYGWFNGRILTWDTTYWQQLGDTATAGYPHGIEVGPYKNFHGLTIWAGHDGTGWSYYFFCETDETIDEEYKFLWKNYLKGTIVNVDIDIDLATGWEYDLCELINETTNEHEIKVDMLYLEPGNPTWYNVEENYGVGHDFKNYRNPSLKATNGYVYIACEKDNDIYIHHSNDKGFTYSSTQITNTEQIETEPKVTGNGNSVAVTYLKNNNLYMTTSINGGKDWREPIRINKQNQSVSMDNDEVDINGNSIIWKDINSTVLFNKTTIDAPIIKIENVTGGIKISASVKNDGNVDATNLPYIIEINGGLLLTKRQITGNISIPAGETKTIQTNRVFFGLGRPTLSIQVGSAVKSIPAGLYFFYFKI